MFPHWTYEPRLAFWAMDGGNPEDSMRAASFGAAVSLADGSLSSDAPTGAGVVQGKEHRETEGSTGIPAPFTARGLRANNLTSQSPTFLTHEMSMLIPIFQQSAWPIIGDEYLWAPFSLPGGLHPLWSLNASTSLPSTRHCFGAWQEAGTHANTGGRSHAELSSLLCVAMASVVASCWRETPLSRQEGLR